MTSNSTGPFSVYHEGAAKSLFVLLAAAALVPLLYLVALTTANYYDMPYADSWGMYYRIANLMNGRSDLWLVFGQYNEARPAVPRILLFFVHSASRNLGIDVILNLGSAAVTAGATLYILKKTNRGISWAALLAASIFFNLNFFSIAQWQNWNWHNQLMIFLPNVFFALGWLINITFVRPLLRGLLVSLCCALSSFSFANGLFQWFLLVPLTFGLSRRERIRVWSLHFGAALVCFVFYFRGYQAPADQHLGVGLAHPGRSITYLFAWLGSSLSAGSILLGGIWGALLLITFLSLGIQCVKSWRTAGLQLAWLPWLSMGGYALISGGMAALGRSHIGLEQALRPRYCTISQWLIVAIIGLSVTLIRQNWQSQRGTTWVGLSLMALFAASFVFFYAQNQVVAAAEWSKFAGHMHFEKQSFGLEKDQPGQLWTFDHPDRNLILTTYPLMEKAGFLRDTFHSNKILPLIAAGAHANPAEGEVEIAAYLPFRQIKCRGWSIGGDARAGNRALVVLIAPETGKVLAVADGPIDQIRPDILQVRKSSPSLAGFDMQFGIPKMAAGTYHLMVFRYGKNERSYFPIGGPMKLAITN
jgi:hypothetical protein